MKITRGGITITEVPGFERIVMETTDDGPVVKLFDGLKITALTSDEVGQLIEALRTAYAGALAMTGTTPAETLILPRAFGKADEIPSDVKHLKDYEGDVWHRLANGAWSIFPGSKGTGHAIDEVMGDYGPLTEVFDA